jgi:hypothetical protein
VYDARDHERGRDVSLRVIPLSFGGDSQRRQRFEREVNAAARVEHPHLLTVHDVGANAQAAYIISEPLNGRTLREVLDDGPIPPGAGIPFVPQIEDAVRAAHGHGVVHGHLTPDAILFTMARATHRRPATGRPSASCRRCSARRLQTQHGAGGGRRNCGDCGDCSGGSVDVRKHHPRASGPGRGALGGGRARGGRRTAATTSFDLAAASAEF